MNKRVNWPTVFFLILFHVLTIIALFFWSWPSFLIAVFLYLVAGSLGIGMGFHRLLTHRSYKTSKPVEYFLALCGTLAVGGGPIQWVVTHRIHHQFADLPGDPHSPRDGKWWSHIGWIIRPTDQLRDFSTYKQYAPDLANQKFYQILDRFYYMPVILLSVILLGFGGWEVLLWGTFLRTTLGWHSIWLVNSATHLWGCRRFNTPDDSKNNWWVALLTFGEGWHNNHHAHPTSARHGLAWYEIDLNWWGIKFFRLLALVKSIKTA